MDSYHEVTLCEAQFVRQTLLFRVTCSALDLVVVVVQPHHVDICELDHLSCWTTNTTADIQNLHVVTKTHNVGEVVLVACNSLFERLTVCEAAEMKGLTPAIL